MAAKFCFVWQNKTKLFAHWINVHRHHHYYYYHHCVYGWQYYGPWSKKKTIITCVCVYSICKMIIIVGGRYIVVGWLVGWLIMIIRPNEKVKFSFSRCSYCCLDHHVFFSFVRSFIQSRRFFLFLQI